MSLTAHAAESPVSQSVSGSGALSFEKINFSWATLVKGSTIQYMDGNSNGKGTNLSWRNYPTLGYRATEKLKVEAGGQFRQYFRPADPKKKGQKDFEWRDPYAGVSLRDLWKGETSSVSAKARYYIPATEYTRLNRNKEYDEGRGSFQVGAAYSQKFMDGTYSLYAPLDVNYRLNAFDHKVRQDYWFGIRPSMAYRVSQSTSARVEYYTGDLNHKTDGTWTRFNDPVIGQTAGVALDWYPVKDLLVSPMVNWGRESFRLNAAEVTLYAKYAFL